MTTRRRTVPADDDGVALILVLIFVLFFSLVGTTVLTLTQANLSTTAVTLDQAQLQYGADAGVQWGKSQVTANGGVCGSLPSAAGVASAAVPGLGMAGIQGVAVQCDPISGASADTFTNGYAVITGAGYTPNSSCVSVASDALGGGVTTDAQGTQTCLTYKSSAAGGSSLWTVQDPGGASVDLNDVFAVDADDAWAVGQATGGAGAQENILYFDGDDWSVITTPGNTGGVSNKNLTGIYAADSDHVWAVGQSGTILYCSSACTSNSATWTPQPAPANTGDIAEISGSGSQVWAVSKHYDTNPGPVHHANVITSSGGGAWTSDAFTTAAPTDLLSSYASDATHVWVTGQGGAIYASTDGGSTWTSQTSGTTQDLSSITGLPGTTQLWAVGKKTNPTNFTVVTSANGTTWSTMTFTAAGAQDLNSVTALKVGATTFVWAVGQAGLLARYDTGTGVWVVQSPPTTTPANPNFLGVSATGSPTEGVWAVGQKANIVFYTPQTSTSVTLASISGGKMYNANAVNFRSGVQVTNGDFEQYQNGSCVSGTPPNRLSFTNGFNYVCTSTTPQTIANSLSEPLPTVVPAAPTKPSNACVSYSVANGCLVSPNTAGCKSYVVFPPGTYSTAPNLKQANVNTYFFQSGIDYFNNVNFGALDDPNNNLWVIGGQPDTANDKSQIFTGSGSNPTPCYSDLTSSSFYTQGTGYGVEWILGGQTWFDVHTVHLELFTRLGGPASEGAQGLSLREVPPSTCASGTLQPCGSDGSFTASAPGGPAPSQIFQVDQNGHIPNVFVHGGLFVPHNNLELYSNNVDGPGTSQVLSGPIDANSIELASQQATGTVQIGAGGSAATTFQLTVVSTGTNQNGGFTEQPFTEQAVIKETSGTWQVLSWRSCVAGSGVSGAAACSGTQR